MSFIQNIDNTRGAGEPLYTGFDKVNEVINTLNTIQDLVDTITITTAEASGTVTSISVEEIETSVLSEGEEIIIVDPESLNNEQLTIASDQAAGATTIFVESKVLQNTYPIGSYIIFKESSLKTGIARLSDRINIYANSTAMGVVNQTLDGTYGTTENPTIDVRLYASVRKGDDLQIVNASTGERYSITVNESSPVSGEVSLTIEEQYIEATSGSLIVGDPARRQAELEVSPAGVQAGFEANRTANSIGTPLFTISDGTSNIQQITLSNISSSVELNDGQVLIIEDKEGESQSITVDGNQTLSSGTGNLDTVAFTAARKYTGGFAWVKEPSYNTTSRLSIAENEILLKVDSNGNIASISLKGDADDGSEININADQITVSGETTFLNSLYSELNSEGYQLDSEVNRIIRSATAPSTRSDGTDVIEGDIWIETDNGNKPYSYDGTSPYNSSGWIADYTIIDGGNITTGTVDAAYIDVSGVITAGSIIVQNDNISQLTNDEDFQTGTDVTTAINNGSNKAYRQNLAPSGAKAGDIWFDTDDGDKPYTYNGTSWIAAYTSIDGGDIETGTVTANEITLTEVNDLGATVGGWSLSATEIKNGTDMVFDSSNKLIYTNNKSTLASTASGVYIDGDTGNFAFGNDTSFVKWDGTTLETSGKIVTGTGSDIGGEYIDALDVGKLTTGTISSETITIGTDGVIITSGFTEGAASGFRLRESDGTIYANDIIVSGGELKTLDVSGTLTMGTGSEILVSNGLIKSTNYSSASGTGYRLASSSAEFLSGATIGKMSISSTGGLEDNTSGVEFGLFSPPVTADGAGLYINSSNYFGIVAPDVGTSSTVWLKYNTNSGGYYLDGEDSKLDGNFKNLQVDGSNASRFRGVFSATTPSSLVAGDWWYDDNSFELNFYDGTSTHTVAV